MIIQHPYIVVDQNQLRNEDAVGKLLDECCRNKLKVLLPDGAFYEFSKGRCPFDTTKRSLKLLAPYRELVCSSRKFNDLRLEELQFRNPCQSLVHKETTEYLRSILEELECGNESKLRQLFDGPNLTFMQDSLDSCNNHEKNREIVQELCNHFKGTFSPDQLKSLRRSPKDGVANWLSSEVATEFVLEGLNRNGADVQLASKLIRSPSINSAFYYALSGLAIYWLAFGGVDTARSTEFSGDLNDIEYVVLGSVSHSLATSDSRASLIYRSVQNSLLSRQKLHSNL